MSRTECDFTARILIEMEGAKDREIDKEERECFRAFWVELGLVAVKMSSC